MATATTETTETTIADLLESLGGIPARRVLFKPVPGTATERDLVVLSERNNRHYELVNGTLVEKAMGFDEALFTYFLGLDLGNYIRKHNLGKPVGDGAMMRLFPGLVRIPDAAFISWGAIPGRSGGKGRSPRSCPTWSSRCSARAIPVRRWRGNSASTSRPASGSSGTSIPASGP